MARPDLETEGHIKIAFSLYAAILRTKLSAAQQKVVYAVIGMTYGAGKTKAEISLDDLRYATGEKRYTLETAVAQLLGRDIVFEQKLVNDSRLLGIQKDYDRWLDKLPKIGSPITSLEEVNNYKPVKGMQNFGSHGFTPPGRWLKWVLEDLALKLPDSAWRAEYAKAVALYKLALDLAHEPRAAMYAMKDYYLELADNGFRTKVTRPASYLLPGFERWYKFQPKKPYQIRQEEERTNKRYRFDTRLKRWQQTNDRI